jgi:endonuclease/exonuclease/phosphatase family metal-dependent hydrolase
MADFIMKSDASVVCMQEVQNDQFDYFKTALAEKYETIWYTRQSATGEGLAIAYDKSEWTLLESERFWLSETPDVCSKGWGAKWYRICVRALLEHKETAAKLNVFNVHLDFGQAQLEGMKLVMERVKASEYPVYVCGDFNGYENSPMYPVIAEYLQDAQQTAHKSDAGRTFNAKGDVADRPDMAIDFCFFTKTVIEPMIFSIHKDKWGTENDQWLSDHYPITTKVRYIYDYRVRYPDTTQNGFDGEASLVS